MKLIRKSVFETNSSSTHSVSIGTSDVYDGVSPKSDGSIILQPMEFGWSYERFTDPMSRLAYAYIYVRDWSNNNQEHFQEMFDKVVKEHTGATSIVMRESSSWHNSYIDHQSVECNALDYLFDSEQTLKQFLFASDSVIITDNDNH